MHIRLLLISPLILAQLTSSQTIPSYSVCNEGESPVFLMQHNVSVGGTIRRSSTNSLIDCTDQCSSSSECAAVTFEQNLCELHGSTDDNGIPRDKVFSKNCVKSARICSSPFHFDAHEQKILVGFAREVVSADTLGICLAACLNAFDNFGFECESIMYYPVDSECILNTEDRLDRPDLFIDELDDNVIYLDNNCAGSQCYAPYITQYIAVSGRQLANELDHHLVADLESCESLCTQRLSTTANDFNCKSFMHNSITNECILSDERSKPLGRANLIDAKEFNYYEKKCFASPRTCRNVPSFERVPQMILVGFAAFVMENVPSVTMCLDQCTNPPPETGENFACKSVMYYYNEQECILNSETRNSKPDLFIPEGEEFLVDYFDITCHLAKEVCQSGTSPKIIRTLNAQLSEGDGSLHVLQSTGDTVHECRKKCYEMAPDKCRSFNFDKHTSECDLMYVDGKTTLRPAVHSGVDLYDLHCLNVTNECSTSKDGATFSRYLYSMHRGVPSEAHKTIALSNCLDICANSIRCEGVNYNRRNGRCELFQHISGNGEPNEFVDFYKYLCLVKEIDSGISAAINVPQNLLPPALKKPQKTEFLSKVKPHIREQEAQRRAPETAHEESQSVAHSVDHTEVKGPLKTPSASLSVSSTGKISPPVMITADSVHTICNYEGIKVQVKNNEAFSGVMFVKNRYDTCRVEVTGSQSATLVLGLPSDFGSRMVNQESSTLPFIDEKPEKLLKEPDNLRSRRQAELPRDCGIEDMLNGTYKSVVVVQTNNLGIPGLVTSMDQLYEVSCDYSSMLGGKVTAGANLSVYGPEADAIQPKGKIELGNPVLMQMLGGKGDHQPVLQAKLGDILELRWEIMAMDEELDFFVSDCYAEPGNVDVDGKEKLQLIENGCPTPAVAQKIIPGPVQIQSSSTKVVYMQAFRFDSSSTVRMTCHLDICLGTCKEANCDLQGGRKQSWGRKKRSANSVDHYETARYKVPRRAQATTSIVIIDPLQQVNEPVAFARSQSFDFIKEEPSLSVTTITNQMCMAKTTMLTVFGILFALTAIQAVVVAQYIFRRLLYYNNYV